MITALSPQLCVHQHPPLKRALLRALQEITVRWAGQKITAEHVAALEAHPVLREFRRAGVPIDFHLAEAVPFLSHVLPLPEGRQWLLSWSATAKDVRLGTFPACSSTTTPFHSECPLKVGGTFAPFSLFSQGSFVRTIRFDRSVQGCGAVLQHLQVLRSCMEEYGKLKPTVAARQSLLLGVSPSSASPWMQIYSGLQLVLAWNEQLRRSARVQYEAVVSAQLLGSDARDLSESLMEPSKQVAQLVSDICTVALQWMLPSHQLYWRSVLMSREELSPSADVGMDLDDNAATAAAPSRPTTWPPRALLSQTNALVDAVIGMRNDVLRQVEEVAGGTARRNPSPPPAATFPSVMVAAAPASAPALLTSPSDATVRPSPAFPSARRDRLIVEINKVGANFLDKPRTELRQSITASLIKERLKFANSTFNGAFSDHTCKYEDKSVGTIQKKKETAETPVAAQLHLLPLAAAAVVVAEEEEEEEEEEDGSEAGPAAKRRRFVYK